MATATWGSIEGLDRLCHNPYYRPSTLNLYEAKGGNNGCQEILGPCATSSKQKEVTIASHFGVDYKELKIRVKDKKMKLGLKEDGKMIRIFQDDVWESQKLWYVQ